MKSGFHWELKGVNMRKFFEDIRWNLEAKLYNYREYVANKKYKKPYPDYEDNEFNCGSLKHIWGIKSWDDLTGRDSSLRTLNDIDITFDRESKLYMLGIETIYEFENKDAECKYLKILLDAFKIYMDDNGYSKDHNLSLRCGSTESSAETIEELYIHFKIFVDGYCSVYDKTK